jgi:hypothetical protein
VSARASLRGLLGGAVALAVASLASADAPSGQYGSYTYNDAWIPDLRTGLNWQRKVTQQFNFAGAAHYCDTLTVGSFTSGWRVPSYKELLTLVDETPNVDGSGGLNVVKRIDVHAFGQPYGENWTFTPVDTAYWTSSLSPTDPTYAYAIDFISGHALSIGTGTQFYVRCVHD